MARHRELSSPRGTTAKARPRGRARIINQRNVAAESVMWYVAILLAKYVEALLCRYYSFVATVSHWPSARAWRWGTVMSRRRRNVGSGMAGRGGVALKAGNRSVSNL